MLCSVGNMTLPTPVFLAGAAACALAGFLVGAVTVPGANDTTTAKVASYSPEKAELCLSGEAVEAWPGTKNGEELCGTWRRTPGAAVPAKGDTFRFVAVETKGESEGETKSSTVIYGDVVD